MLICWRLIIPIVVLSVSAYVLTTPTSSGRPTGPGVAACGPSYPFGTRFILPDKRTVTCYDRGGEVTDGHLDVWMRNYDDAMRWGRQRLSVGVRKADEPVVVCKGG